MLKSPSSPTLALSLLGLAALSGCVGSTGGELLTFDAFAAGPEDAIAGEPYTFETSRGYSVTLSRARLHVGAVYLNQSRPASVASDTGCFLPGVYVAEVTTGLDVDLLSPELQPFPEQGSGITGPALAGEVWLFGGDDVNDPTDDTEILDVEGVARKDGVDLPFEGEITISDNRVIPPASPAQPGANPICKQRIVTPIPVDLDLAVGDSLVLRADPRAMLDRVQFAELPEGGGSPPVRRFEDDDGTAPDRALYDGLRSASGTYRFSLEK